MMTTGSKYHHGDLKNALIQAGLDVLARDGVASLSLREVARQAEVSHAAPYAHFADKQALIAAISTESFKQLYAQLTAVRQVYAAEPQALLPEIAWAYVQFARSHPDRFKLMFSGVLEQEKDYPDFVEISQQTFYQLVEIIEICQQAGLLTDEEPKLVATRMWASVHGFTALLLEGQISHTVLEKGELKEIVTFMLGV
ncbi:MAG: TetR/AcrR family transcriptional regulator [Anaerolineales bacterium]|nr:TetR/AcrR family transcriptional regulator [Anaerolineales bacterium]